MYIRSHPKVSKDTMHKILNHESILTHQDRELVESIQAFVTEQQTSAYPYIQTLHDLEKTIFSQESKLSQLEEGNSSLENLIDKLENHNNIKVSDIIDELLERNQNGSLQISDNITSKEELISHFNIKNSNNNYEIFIDRLKDIKDKQEKIINKLNDEIDKNYEVKDKLQTNIEEHKRKIAAYQKESKVKLTIDDNLNLLKVHKSSKNRNGPEFSVIFAETPTKEPPSNITPYILYRGKQHALGEGGFATVKLVQNFNNHNLLAVKIQDSHSFPEEVYAKEEKMLTITKNYYGKTKMDDANKIYIFQRLLYGAELEKIIAKKELNPISIMDICYQLSQNIQHLHHSDYIHRDLKLENIIWDEATKTCDLIDYGFTESLNGKESITTRDQAGTEGYMAPECIEQGIYSKKSDFYALGIIMQELTKHHPILKEQLKECIASLTNPNPEKRPDNLNKIILFLATYKLKSELNPKFVEKITRPSMANQLLTYHLSKIKRSSIYGKKHALSKSSQNNVSIKPSDIIQINKRRKKSPSQ